MKLCMIGTGYVGLVSGVCFSDLGNDVICVDKDYNKINNLKNGKIPIYEPGLEELVRKNSKNKRLNFSTNLRESVKKSDIIFICVGTPTKKNSNSADLKYVFSVAKELKKIIKSYKIIITKSTVPVTTGDKIENIRPTIQSLKAYMTQNNYIFCEPKDFSVYYNINSSKINFKRKVHCVYLPKLKRLIKKFT